MAFSLISVLVLTFTILRVLQVERSGQRMLIVIPFLLAALLECSTICARNSLFSVVPWQQRFVVFVEALLPACWLLVSLSYARDNNGRSLGRWAWLVVMVSTMLVLVPSFIPTECFFHAQDFPVGRLFYLTDTGFYFYLGIFIPLMGAMANFEATLVNAPPDDLWRMKIELVALCSMLALLIYYYGHLLLSRTLTPELLPLRSLIFMVATVMMAYARFHRRGTARVKVSRGVFLRSVSLAAISGYFFLPGLLREGMDYFGPNFARVITLSLAFLVGILFVLMLLSEGPKREFKLFLHKLLYLSKYDYRTQWLGFTETIATVRSGEELLQRVLGSCCQMFGVQGAALFLHQEGCGWFCATGTQDLEKINVTIAEENSLVSYLKERQWVFCSKDENPEILAENSELIERYRISFVIPLFESEVLVGFIVLGTQVVPNEQYRYEDYDLMKAVARQACEAIQRQRFSEQLAQARAMEVVGSLATFIVHDLKNLAATISLIVENAEALMDNQDFRKEMLGGLGHTSQKMHRLIERLRNLKDTELVDLRPVDLLDLVQRCVVTFQGGGITVRGNHVQALVDEDEVQKVVLNLVLNAVEASCPGAEIIVEVGFAEAPFIRVKDKGCGMSPRFVQRELFTPFRTTKDSGLGVGLYQCRQIMAAHGGRMAVTSAEGSGTVFTVWFQAMNDALRITQTA